jgi:hypothetical protein
VKSGSLDRQVVSERNISSVSFKADGTSDTWVQRWPLRVVRIMTGRTTVVAIKASVLCRRHSSGMHSRWFVSFVVSSIGLQAYELSIEHFHHTRVVFIFLYPL